MAQRVCVVIGSDLTVFEPELIVGGSCHVYVYLLA
jgi:hypothetical protein